MQYDSHTKGGGSIRAIVPSLNKSTRSIFQQNHTRLHIARSTTDWCLGVWNQLLLWTLISPDLPPIGIKCTLYGTCYLKMTLINFLSQCQEVSLNVWLIEKVQPIISFNAKNFILNYWHFLPLYQPSCKSNFNFNIKGV